MAACPGYLGWSCHPNNRRKKRARKKERGKRSEEKRAQLCYFTCWVGGTSNRWSGTCCTQHTVGNTSPICRPATLPTTHTHTHTRPHELEPSYTTNNAPLMPWQHPATLIGLGTDQYPARLSLPHLGPSCQLLQLLCRLLSLGSFAGCMRSMFQQEAHAQQTA